MNYVVPRSLARPADAHFYVISIQSVRGFIGQLTLLTALDQTSPKTLTEWVINVSIKSS